MGGGGGDTVVNELKLSTDQVGPGVHTLEWIFFQTCLQGLRFQLKWGGETQL